MNVVKEIMLGSSVVRHLYFVSCVVQIETRSIRPTTVLMINTAQCTVVIHPESRGVNVRSYVCADDRVDGSSIL